MILKNAARRGSLTAFLLLVMLVAFLWGNQSLAYADPLGSDIVCGVFNTLTGLGQPISDLHGGNCPSSTPPPPQPAACSDGVDNDGDGLIDAQDPGCSSVSDTDEANPPPATEGKLIVIKIVINDNNGTSTISSFPLHISTSSPAGADAAVAVTSGATTTVVAGMWWIGEVQQPSYAGTFGGDCDSNGQVSVGVGETKTCTITNDDIPPAPPPAACTDGVDNDGDGLIDSADPGCSSASDGDETNTPAGNGQNDNQNGGSPPGPSGGNPPSNSGGGPPVGILGGSSGGGGGSFLSLQSSESGSPGLVLGAATGTATTSIAAGYSAVEIASCERYLTDFIRAGKENDAEQVTRLQKFLRDFEGAKVAETGTYDGITLAAVHAFQTKYAADILTPWGIQKSTGFVYLTTRKKVNEIFCRNTKTFLFTPDELKKIIEARAPSAPVPSAHVPSPAPMPAVPRVNNTVPVKVQALPIVTTTQTGVQGAAERRGPMQSMVDFLRGMLNRSH